MKKFINLFKENLLDIIMFCYIISMVIAVISQFQNNTLDAIFWLQLSTIIYLVFHHMDNKNIIEDKE